MYIVTGGGYGGSMEFDDISNGCSTIGIAKTPPIEILEQRFPVLFKEFSIAEQSAGAGRHRGGFGVRYSVALRRGEARASFVMDYGREGGVLGGEPGQPNRIEIEQEASCSFQFIFPRIRTSSSEPAIPSTFRLREAEASADQPNVGPAEGTR